MLPSLQGAQLRFARLVQKAFGPGVDETVINVDGNGSRFILNVKFHIEVDNIVCKDLSKVLLRLYFSDMFLVGNGSSIGKVIVE